MMMENGLDKEESARGRLWRSQKRKLEKWHATERRKAYSILVASSNPADDPLLGQLSEEDLAALKAWNERQTDRLRAVRAEGKAYEHDLDDMPPRVVVVALKKLSNHPNYKCYAAALDEILRQYDERLAKLEQEFSHEGTRHHHPLQLTDRLD